MNRVTTYSWSYENQLDRLAKPDGTLTTYQYAPVTRFSDELRRGGMQRRSRNEVSFDPH